MLIRSCAVAFAVSVFITTISPQRIKSEADVFVVQWFDTLWLVTYIDASGHETIARAPAPTGELVPLMATDEGWLQSIIEASKAIAASRRIKFRLVKFTQRSEIGEFAPAPWSIERINGPMLFQLTATPAEYKAGLDRAIANGWPVLHESGTFVRFTQAGADLFA
jgi:hypothetical protein